ncbi:D-glycero-beta-D-manno-heptose 1,7-bisphosphate 7-phosphatase [Paucibacter sp. O1-1]|nr:D-glycero-beta-D-manno-heptose 1,7-bisphosphate 7-phosphatase [Paucibacter sp. O1-1]MDA3827772.1 D-glycero-beta-D-manno-heptose 1,7-bisphosphate 7-phosphatase [Paucibacter sp. O1-1]
MADLRNAAFLDRDGVINIDHGYVHRWEEFEFVPGAVEAMRRLQEAGYLLVVVTNQSGIARGMYSEADFHVLSAHLREHLAAQGVSLAAIEYCPHLPDAQRPAYRAQCACRKPAPGMLLQAARALRIDLGNSLMFGDKPSDIEAAQRAKVGRAVLLAQNGQGPLPGLPSALNVGRSQSLATAVAELLDGR